MRAIYGLPIIPEIQNEPARSRQGRGGVFASMRAELQPSPWIKFVSALPPRLQDRIWSMPCAAVPFVVYAITYRLRSTREIYPERIRHKQDDMRAKALTAALLLRRTNWKFPALRQAVQLTLFNT